MAVHILGIRHHGPGSARNVKEFLERVKPDIVLVEGPPEADGLLEWVGHNELKPPVAILVYQSDDTQNGAFYPFAEFSPEWQAISYARAQKIHVRFFDLPAAHQFALEKEKREAARKEAERLQEEAQQQVEGGNGQGKTALEEEAAERPNSGSTPDAGRLPADAREQLEGNNGNGKAAIGGEPVLIGDATTNGDAETVQAVSIRRDPISYLAEAAGYPDGEKWWEHMFEHRLHSEQVFEAVMEAMQVLRETIPQPEDRMEACREAWMRKCIRQAEKEMFQNIVVICGAWHAPALKEMPSQKEDSEVLKGLPKVKIECTWIPWTFSRLGYFSGYGAGIRSPGWYNHVWKYPADDGTRWMAKVAKLFRKEGKDTSVAHVIEAIRLAEALASLRQYSKAGLAELNEATLSVLCGGEAMPMQLIQSELIVSNRIGAVPETIPKPPLQLDIEKLQKRLRLPATADWKDYTLDLRKENDLERSIFLHRLQLLEINWGAPQGSSGKGTFKEAWRLQWDPELSIEVVEKGNWGNTVAEAAEKYALHQGKEAGSLGVVCELLDKAIPAEVHGATAGLIDQINNIAAASGDVIQLMGVIPSLVSVTRYGNVRKTDGELLLGIVDSMITRICIGLPAATTGINDEVAYQLLELFGKLNDAVSLLQNSDITAQWQSTLQTIAHSQHSAPVIRGYATRLLTDYKILEGEGLIKAFSYAMSAATPADIAAAWLEGFLKGSGTILLLDQQLWNLVNNWVASIPPDVFTQVLPLLRRTFANFSQPERRKLGEKVKSGGIEQVSPVAANGDIDPVRARKGIPVILQLLGITQTTSV
ncbi:DUF5682 family protein [Paraflavitalea sp. CAU 1676]|uniref:DUF5682 family protein n=1 Tax=Paraflavitalea sp. CAU 1676 TaxID=3032598 RepID=UPI0023DC0F8B|nr:DUF5682 family protein [Paraflavitalea sp. CAU 1676]MDF2191197.1 DUF5682 family protein [Paraflavitalea sp. CAU 1676]